MAAVIVALGETFKYVLSHIYVLGENMANMTLSMPDEVQEDMKEFPEIRWSEVARRAIIEKVEALKLAESLAKKSKLTQKDVDEFSKKVKALGSRRFRHANRN